MPPASDPLSALALSSVGTHGILFTFLLFVIPTGAGIPAGVLLGHGVGLSVTSMSGLYVGSGLLRAALFEPLFRFAARRQHAGGRIAGMRDRVRDGLGRSAVLTRMLRSAWAPLIVSFNIDPMAGRVAAAAIGMGWLRGWALALVADLAYFITTAVPTLWLQSVLGNLWLTLGVFILLSTAIPFVGRRLWRRLRGSTV